MEISFYFPQNIVTLSHFSPAKKKTPICKIQIAFFLGHQLTKIHPQNHPKKNTPPKTCAPSYH